MLLIAVLIRLESKGGVVFSQKRMGYRGKIFTLYKFRTMYVEKKGRDLLREKTTVGLLNLGGYCGNIVLMKHYKYLMF